MNDPGEDFFDQVAADLDRFADLPTDHLHDTVSRSGLCQWLYTSRDAPAWSGDEWADRLIAERVCSDCPVAGECLELELRTAGYATDSLWGLLAADERRRVFLSWVQRRDGGDRP